VLGIYSQKLTPEQAKELELEPEQGLRIERVEPGTIAQILGVRRGDTLVELNGKAIYSTDDVRKVLKERKTDEDLSVTLIGEGSHERRTLRWSPSVPQPGAEKPRKL
jgi:S1-C subfamily serine protease